MVNTFTVHIHLSEFLTKKIGILDEKINLNIISFSSPDFTCDPIEAFVANKWVIHNGRDSLYKFTITFRDQDQMVLYRKFLKIYKLTKGSYFDNIKMSITLIKDADWLNEEDKELFTFNGVLIEGISNLSLSNDTENQIAEFTVSFKCNAYSIKQ
jgi:hypothetical protein